MALKVVKNSYESVTNMLPVVNVLVVIHEIFPFFFSS